MSNARSVIWPALVAVALFGASTPLVKLLVGELPTLLLAGLLYLGSGLGLAAIRLLRDRGWKPSGLAPGNGAGLRVPSSSAAVRQHLLWPHTDPSRLSSGASV